MATKPARTARLSDVGESGRRILTLAERVTSTVYWLDEAKDGSYLLEKFTDGDVYHVTLHATGDSCTCPGHRRWGHKTVCKHVAAVNALKAAGRL